MMLNPDEVRAVYHCVSVVRRALMPGCCPRWLDDLFGRFDAEHKRLMSVGGHESAEFACASASLGQWLSSRETADLLGLTARQVRRLTADLQAVQVDGRWLFDRRKVLAYREGRE